MIIRDVQIDVGSLDDLPFVRADMVLRLVTTDGAVRLVARDASTGQFAGLSASRTPGGWRNAGDVDEAVITLFALSPDGSHLLLGDPGFGPNRLSLHTMATGAAVILPSGPGDDANAAAFAPDGKRARGNGPRRLRWCAVRGRWRGDRAGRRRVTAGKAVDVCTAIDAATAARLTGEPYTEAVPQRSGWQSACAYDNDDAAARVWT